MEAGTRVVNLVEQDTPYGVMKVGHLGRVLGDDQVLDGERIGDFKMAGVIEFAVLWDNPFNNDNTDWEYLHEGHVGTRIAEFGGDEE